MANPTIVSGVIVDPGSIPYYPATVTATLSPTTINPTANGKPINPNPGLNMTVVAPTNTDGSFTMSLFGNAAILPGGTQWLFTVTTTGAARPAGFGMETFSVAITVSGTTQDVGTTLSAAAPDLLQVDSGGGGGGAVLLAPTGDQTITGDHDLILAAGELHVAAGDAYFLSKTFSGADADESDATGNHLFDWADLNVAVPADAQWSVNSFRTVFNPSLDITSGLYNGYFVVGTSVGNTHAINEGANSGLFSIYGEAVHNGTGFVSELNGTRSWVGNESSGHVERLWATNTWAENDADGTVGRMVGHYTYVANFGTGLVDEAYGILVDAGDNFGPTTLYEGLRLSLQTGILATTGIGLHITGAQGTASTAIQVDAGSGVCDLGDGLKVTGNIGFYGGTPAAKPTVAGAKLPSDVVLASLLTGLVSLGLITDSST